ncbi:MULTISPECIES: hypothetical protein [unclassified Acidovorax]|uniref:hypothetical protein n=1 Tax=unclassified Acidovorax TaxID=2684926 RepID=UPI0023DE41C7|nr:MULTISPECIES: hypothetical protein [unclassified Acidovorax]GKS87435.1 hypothetical protein AVMA1855_24805 [Acidovorax sp. SUPP1855]GKS95584.1 hypothetical protein AVAK2825_13635 [Acidovorax sp. SUPP2825]
MKSLPEQALDARCVLANARVLQSFDPDQGNAQESRAWWMAYALGLRHSAADLPPVFFSDEATLMLGWRQGQFDADHTPLPIVLETESLAAECS